MNPRRCELTDFGWLITHPLLPNKPRGVPRVDDRRVLNGIYWRMRTGSPWADIPERYGAPTMGYNCFVRWRKLGVWDRVFAAVSRGYDGDLQMIDTSSIRVHQHAANVKKQRRSSLGRERRFRAMHGAIARRSDNQNPCRGRRERQSDPPETNEGQAHDGASAADMLDQVGAEQTLLADRAYDSDALRQAIVQRGGWVNIKPTPNRKNIPAFSAWLYRYRNLLERFFNKLKHYGGAADAGEFGEPER